MFKQHLTLICIYSMLFTVGCKTTPQNNNLYGSASRAPSSKKNVSKKERLNRLVQNLLLSSIGSPHYSSQVIYEDRDTGDAVKISQRGYTNENLETIRQSQNGVYKLSRFGSFFDDNYITLEPSMSEDKKRFQIKISEVESRRGTTETTDVNIIRFDFEKLKNKRDFEKKILSAKHKIQNAFANYSDRLEERFGKRGRAQLNGTYTQEFIALAIGTTIFALCAKFLYATADVAGANKEVIYGYLGIAAIGIAALAGMFIALEAYYIFYKMPKEQKAADKMLNQIREDYEHLIL